MKKGEEDSMRRSIFTGALLLGVALLFAPMDTAQAKEIPPDGNIPLTSEFFPDEWLLDWVKWYDEDKDGFLSPEEVASVTVLEFEKDLSDFSQVQYFTNLKTLVLEYEKNYGPLTLDTTKADQMWLWATQPMPWEGGYC